MRISLALAVVAACTSDPSPIRVDLSIDVAACMTELASAVALPCAGSVGARLASRADCRTLPANSARTAADLPTLYAGMDVGPVPGDELVQLVALVYQDEESLTCPYYDPPFNPTPALYGESEQVRLEDSGGWLHLELTCPLGPPTATCPF